jgi:pimeloyl-ACP methyl ester carboxylesterase/enoyl-CoA hydratase/carnithine racemase
MGIEQIQSSWQGKVLAIELHSGDGKNELSDEAVVALTALLEQLPADAAAVTLHGVGGHFCGGRAAGPPAAIPPGVDPRVAIKQGAMEQVNRLYAALLQCPVPVAAFADGLSSGLGCALLACADYAEAEASAVFDAPELGKQFTPGLLMAAVSQRVTAKGLAQMVLSMQPVEAGTALAYGLIGRIVPDGGLALAREQFVRRVNSRSPDALRGIKRFLRDSADLDAAARRALGEELTADTVLKRMEPFVAQAESAAHVLQIGAEQIAYSVAGSGSPLVLLHSLGTSMHLWDAVMPWLTEHHQVVRVDARGHGQSGCKGTCDPELLSQDVLAVAEHLGLARFALVGISMSGLTACRIAASVPDRVSALVLGSAYPSVKGPLFEQRAALIEKTLARSSMSAFGRAYAENTLHPDTAYPAREKLARWVAGMSKENYLNSLRAMGSDDVTSMLPSIKAPTLVLSAEVDLSVPRELSRQFLQGISGAQERIVAGARHLACIDQPAAYAASLIDFLRPHGGR